MNVDYLMTKHLCNGNLLIYLFGLGQLKGQYLLTKKLATSLISNDLRLYLTCIHSGFVNLLLLSNQT